MPIEFTCPRCQATLRTREETVGHQTRCPECRARLVIPSSGAALLADGAGGMQMSAEIPWDDSPPGPEESAQPFRHGWEELDPLAPEGFSVHGALWFGWRLFRARFFPFFVGNLLSWALIAAWAATSWSAHGRIGGDALSLAAGGALFLFMSAGWAALAVHAAHGELQGPAAFLSGLKRPIRVLKVLGAWSLITLLWHAPFLCVWWSLWQYGSAFWQLMGGLAVLAAGILSGVRIGWVPFALWEYPEADFRTLLRHSLEISRGRTAELLQLAFLTYFALAGLAVAIPVFALPLAMGIGGAAYVLLARETPLAAAP